MPSQGPNSGSSFTTTTDYNGIGGDWTNPSRAAASDDTYAGSGNLRESGWNSDSLRATGFGFAIPADATITQVVVDIERRIANGSLAFADKWVSLYKGGSPTGTALTPGTPIPGTDTYQSFTFNIPADASLTAAEINDSGFGVGYAAGGNGPSNSSTSINVDHIQITVHYTEPVGVPLFMHHYRMRRAR